MATISTIRAGLAARLSTVDGLRVQEDGLAPGSITPAPGKAVAVVTPADGTFLLRDSQGSYALSFTVRLVVSAAVTPAAQKALDAYLDTSSDQSVIAAIEEGTAALGGDFAVVTSAGSYGDVEYGGVTYFGAEVAVDVAAT